jgi:hypothetical protein
MLIFFAVVIFNDILRDATFTMFCIDEIIEDCCRFLCNS